MWPGANPGRVDLHSSIMNPQIGLFDRNQC
jgi:hypothetical protein